jgi:hypothetical protein
MKEKYISLKRTSFEQYALLLEKLSHFNFASNLLKIVMKKLSSFDILTRKICSAAFFSLMS